MVTFTFAGKTFYGHTGGADNYGAWLAYLPEEKLAIAYTTNAKIYPVKNISAALSTFTTTSRFRFPPLNPSPSIQKCWTNTSEIIRCPGPW
jgi:CubicO group peptidase (beta-lactamase class C family)